MEGQKPKSVKVIGIITIILSGFIMFCNLMGSLAFTLINLSSPTPTQATPIDAEFSLLGFLWEHYVAMCLVMLTLGFLFMMGGIKIRKYKMWANRLLSVVSVIIFLAIWTVTIAMIQQFTSQEGMAMFSIAPVFAGIVFSAPLLLLVGFLNHKKIKVHFE